MNIKFIKITTGNSPQIGALVDDVLVAWARRGAQSAYTTGWQCREHGGGPCAHTDAVEALLPDRLVDRLEQIEHNHNTQEDS